VNWFWEPFWWLVKADEKHEGTKLIDPTRDRLPAGQEAAAAGQPVDDQPAVETAPPD
jgi:hypothetical protein